MNDLREGMQKLDEKKEIGKDIATPNFLRVAREVSKFKRPYKTANTLLLFVENSMKNSANTK